ncbi:hypothetical protein [Streptomyces sp. NPDC055400]
MGFLIGVVLVVILVPLGAFIARWLEDFGKEARGRRFVWWVLDSLGRSDRVDRQMLVRPVQIGYDRAAPQQPQFTILKTVVARVTVGSHPTPTADERPLTR